MPPENDDKNLDAAAIAAAEKAAADARAAAEKEAADKLAESKNKGDDKDQDMIKKLVQDRLDAELKTIKDNLDKSYAARDAALKRVVEFEQKEKQAQIKALEDEGKHKEAYELKLAEMNAKNAELEKRNTELSRDVAVRDALKQYVFRNDKASDMASKDITAQLIQNDKGQWVHRSGISIKDFVEAFCKDDEQSFLFKSKQNSGAGNRDNNNNNGAPDDTGKPKSLFAMSQAEVIKLAAENKLPRRK